MRILSRTLLALCAAGALAQPLAAAETTGDNGYQALEQLLAKLESTPAQRGQLPPVPPASSLTVGSLDNLPLIAAPDLATALAATVHRRQTGVTVVKGAEGYGYAATGRGAWTPAADPVTNLKLRRAALLTAWINAKAALTKGIAGQSVQGRSSVLSALLTTNTGSSDRSLSVDSVAQSVETSSRAVLQGLSTWAVDQVPGAGEVFVTVVSTPASRALAERNGLVLAAPHLASGVAAITAELRTGVVPPVGARAVTLAGNRGTALVGYGSQVVSHSANAALQAKLLETAAKQAEMLALDALVGALNGDFTSTAAKHSESQTEIINEFTATDSALLAGVQSGMRNNSSMTEVSTSVRSGRLPGTVRVERWTSDGGAIAWASAVYLPAVTPDPVPTVEAATLPALPPVAATPATPAGRPAWMDRRPADAEFLYGIGEASLTPQGNARSASNARLDLAQQFFARIEGVQVTESRVVSTTDDKGSTNQSLDALVNGVRIRVDEQRLAAAEVIEQITAGSTVYTLVRMQRAQGARDLQARITELDARLTALNLNDTSAANLPRLLRGAGEQLERQSLSKMLLGLGIDAGPGPLATGAMTTALGRLADSPVLYIDGEATGPTTDVVRQIISGWGLGLSPEAPTRLGLRITTQRKVRIVDGWHRVSVTGRVEPIINGAVAGQIQAVGEGNSTEGEQMAADRAATMMEPKLRAQLEGQLFELLAGPRK